MQSWISRNLILWPATYLKGERIPRYLREYRTAQWFPPDQIRGLQAAALGRLLRHCSGSEFHRKRGAALLSSSSGGERLLDGLPLMTKTDLAESLDEIVVKSHLSGATRKTTGGSTGQPVTLLKNPDALARERAATYRAYEWAGVEPGAPQGRFWGVPHTSSRRLYYAIADIVANRRRFSAFNFNEETLNRYFLQLVKFRPKYLYGYVSMLHQFARFVHETKRRIPNSVVGVITTSEVLTDGVRSQLKSWLGVPVFNEYGCGEVGSIAHECEHGRLHIMAENLIVEIIDEAGRPAKQGEIVVTDLHNMTTPLIRYRLGDFATIQPGVCECGRGLPCIEKIHGRAYDMVQTPSGLKVHPESIIYVFEMLKEQGLPISQFQVEQVSRDLLVIRLVGNVDASMEAQVAELLRRYVSSEFRLEFQRVSSLARERSGKLRLVKRSFRGDVGASQVSVP